MSGNLPAVLTAILPQVLSGQIFTSPDCSMLAGRENLPLFRLKNILLTYPPCDSFQRLSGNPALKDHSLSFEC